MNISNVGLDKISQLDQEYWVSKYGEAPMFDTTIQFKDDIPENKLKELKEKVVGAFNNRSGKLDIEINDKEPLVLKMQGQTPDYGTMILGILSFKKDKDFLKCLEKFEYRNHTINTCEDFLEIVRKRYGDF